MNFTIKRQSRKTAAIHVLPDGTVEVRAPKSVSQEFLQEFVDEHEEWILKRQSELKARNDNKERFTKNGIDKMLLLGKEYPVKRHPENAVSFDNKALSVPESLPFSAYKNAVINVYKNLAKQYLIPRVSYFADIMDVKPAVVKVSSAARRWGSCSGRKSINFSWRLIMAPREAVDYVIVHELAHLTAMNHSPRFWNIVESVLPDYKEREKLLKNLQNKLNNEEW